MKLVIVRHGETIANSKDICQGWKPGKLSEKGKEQAEKLAQRLLKEKIDLIYCSDLRRCKQTVEPFLKINKVPIFYVKDLREVSKGIFEEKHLDLYRKWLNENVTSKDFDFRQRLRTPKGESFLDVKKRTRKFLDKLIKKHKGKNILIVTHGGSKQALMLNIFGKEGKEYRKKYRSANTGLSIVYIKDDGNHKARLLNSVKHLEK